MGLPHVAIQDYHFLSLYRHSKVIALAVMMVLGPLGNRSQRTQQLETYDPKTCLMMSVALKNGLIW